ncbi:hypothetical protein GCM10022243_09320 [Saccharothrix violaceirubra]|uniref:DUF4034 domain-containing protein n=1 Tax=Saccharothrix violaceirubra TaxID=413306 RepID=A0A7W7T486_9PSEU|nr:DUF4034 domain-containing protein [Saccharothrix violaceirubra]MBB4966231.1 hypothetical protein [Saccharothrix violaceirubra]
MGLLTVLTKPRFTLAMISLSREAKRLGKPWDDYVSGAALRARMVTLRHPSRWGLPAEWDITDEPFVTDPDLAAALAARRKGDWKPVARVLESIGTDWARRAHAVDLLAAHTWSDRTSWLDKWLTAEPESPDAAVVRLGWLVAHAWVLRGADRAHNTSAEQFAGFHRVLRTAVEQAKRASALAPDDPTPRQHFLTIARGLGFPPARFPELWADLLRCDPSHRGGHRHALQYWRPHWYGSYPKMFAFADEAAAKSPALASVRIVAAVEACEDHPDTWRAPELAQAVDTTLAWVDGDGDGADSPTVREDRALLAVALVELRRYDEALAQFRVLDRNADASVWGRLWGDERMGFTYTRARAYQHVRPTTVD